MKGAVAVMALLCVAMIPLADGQVVALPPARCAMSGGWVAYISGSIQKQCPGGGVAVRQCNDDGRWGAVDFDGCDKTCSKAGGVPYTYLHTDHATDNTQDLYMRGCYFLGIAGASCVSTCHSNQRSYHAIATNYLWRNQKVLCRIGTVCPAPQPHCFGVAASNVFDACSKSCSTSTSTLLPSLGCSIDGEGVVNSDKGLTTGGVTRRNERRVCGCHLYALDIVRATTDTESPEDTIAVEVAVPILTEKLTCAASRTSDGPNFSFDHGATLRKALTTRSLSVVAQHPPAMNIGKHKLTFSVAMDSAETTYRVYCAADYGGFFGLTDVVLSSVVPLWYDPGELVIQPGPSVQRTTISLTLQRTKTSREAYVVCLAATSTAPSVNVMWKASTAVRTTVSAGQAGVSVTIRSLQMSTTYKVYCAVSDYSFDVTAGKPERSSARSSTPALTTLDTAAPTTASTPAPTPPPVCTRGTRSVANSQLGPGCDNVAIGASCATACVDGYFQSVSSIACVRTGNTAEFDPFSCQPMGQFAYGDADSLVLITRGVAIGTRGVPAVDPGLASQVDAFRVTEGVLPNGVQVSTQNGALTGTPTTVSTSLAEVVITGFQGSIEIASARFTIQVIPPLAPFSYILANNNAMLSRGKPVSAPVLWVQSESTGVVSRFTYSGSMPPALTLSVSSGAITGAPSGPVDAEYVWTVIAEDAGGGPAREFTIRLRVIAPLVRLKYNGGVLIELEKGEAMLPLLPTYDGTARLFDTLTGLPDGLALDAATGEISGEPTSAGAQKVYKVRAHDAGSATIVLSSLRIVVRSSGGLYYSEGSPLRTAGQPIATLTPVLSLSGGAQASTTTYSILDAHSHQLITPWLNINPTTGHLTGVVPSSIPTTLDMPAVVQAQYTEGALDQYFNTTLTFRFCSPVSVTYDTSLGPADGSEVWTLSALSGYPLITASTLIPLGSVAPTAVEGLPLAYSFSTERSKPIGVTDLLWVDENGELGGEFPQLPPGTVRQQAEVWLSVSDRGSERIFHVELEFDLVPALTEPAFPLPRYKFAVGHEIRAAMPTVAAGAVRRWASSVEDVVPGLLFDEKTGTITGTPVSLTEGVRGVLFTAFDAGSEKWVEGIVDIGVIDELTNVTYNEDREYVFTQYETITERDDAILQPVLASGEAYDFEVPGRLPPGVQVHPVTGAVYGVPTTLDELTVSVLAYDFGAYSHQVPTSFRMRVIPPLGNFTMRFDPRLRSQSPPNRLFNATSEGPVLEFVLGQPLKNMTALFARGRVVRYSLSGLLPEGMAFDETNGAFSGQANQVGDWQSVTLTAWDEGSTRTQELPLVFRVVASCGGMSVDCAARNRLPCDPVTNDVNNVCGACLEFYNDGGSSDANAKCRKDENTTLFLIITLSVFALLLLLVLFLHSKNASANNAAVFSVALAMFDLVTDVFFVKYLMEQADDDTQDMYDLLQWMALGFVIVPVLVNSVACVCLVAHEMSNQAFKRWYEANQFVITCFFTLGAANVDILTILNSRILNLPAFSAPWTAKTGGMLKVYGLISLMLEDVPQVVMQIMVILDSANVSTVVWASCIASIAAIIYGVFRRLFQYFFYKSERNEERQMMFSGADDQEQEIDQETAREAVKRVALLEEELALLKNAGEGALQMTSVLPAESEVISDELDRQRLQAGNTAPVPPL